MGEARRRGSFEERKARAIARDVGDKRFKKMPAQRRELRGRVARDVALMLALASIYALPGRRR